MAGRRSQCGSYGAILCPRSVGVALVRMHTFQVGEHYLAVEDVLMFTASVFDHSVRDRFLVLANELSSATWTLLSELHSGLKFMNGRRPGCEKARAQASAAVVARPRASLTRRLWDISLRGSEHGDETPAWSVS